MFCILCCYIHVLEDHVNIYSSWTVRDIWCCRDHWLSCSVSFSPLPLAILSEFSQFLFTTKLPDLLDDLPLHLSFIKRAAAHAQINPLVSRVLCTVHVCMCCEEEMSSYSSQCHNPLWGWNLSAWFYHFRYIPISLVILTLPVGLALLSVVQRTISQEHPFTRLKALAKCMKWHYSIFVVTGGWKL